MKGKDWLDDELVPISPEESSRLLREAIEEARIRGWIPLPESSPEPPKDPDTNE